MRERTAWAGVFIVAALLGAGATPVFALTGASDDARQAEAESDDAGGCRFDPPMVNSPSVAVEIFRLVVGGFKPEPKRGDVNVEVKDLGDVWLVSQEPASWWALRHQRAEEAQGWRSPIVSDPGRAWAWYAQIAKCDGRVMQLRRSLTPAGAQ